MDRVGFSLLLWLALLPWSRSSGAKERSCQEISVPLCRGVGYNFTHMPNSFQHDSQDEAGLEVHQFWPLVEIRCSADLRFFLCSLYTPICLEDYLQPLPPCRSVCERARAGCAPLMRQYGFPWPDRMRCDLLPVQGSPDSLCMDYNGTEPSAAPPAGPTNPPDDRPARGACEEGCRCAEPLVRVTSDRHPLFNRVRTGQVRNCAMPCHSPFFTHEERAFTALWLGLWAALCFASTLATVATFLIEPGRYRYPERPIFFLSACYLLVSAGFIVRLLAGHEQVACSRDPEPRHVHYEGAGPALCTLVFLLVYVFGMAGSVWWVVLTLSWFLAAALKWGSEAIAGYAHYFHAAAWLLPGAKAAAVLALGAVDGDSVSGICSVGNQDVSALRGFVLAPLLLYLCAGGALLLAGLVSLFRIRSAIRRGGSETDPLERLMARIGAFTLLHAVPASVIVACTFYEQHNRDSWERAHTCAGCAPERERRRPDYWVFMLKYFMVLLVGITSGAWIWSGKTVESWRTFCTRCCWGSKAGGGSTYSEASTGLTWRSGTASSVSCPKQLPRSQV